MSIPSQKIINTLQSIAKQYQHQQQLNLALASYQQILTYQPKHTNSLLQIASIYEQTNQIDQANTTYQSIIATKPNQVDALKNLGINYAISDNYQQAKSFLLQAHQLQPQNHQILNNLANVYKKLGDTDQAVSIYLEALTIAPQQAELRYNLGVLLQSQGKLEEAIIQYQAAIESNPNDPDTHNNLGITLAKLDRFQEAIEQFRLALTLEPNSTSTMTNLFNHLRSLGQVQEADQIQQQLQHQLQHELSLGQQPGVTPFLSLIIDPQPATNFQVARLWSQTITKSTSIIRQQLNFLSPPIQNKLKIGYLSNGFRDFPTGHNLTAVLEHHNHSKFEIFAYSYGKDDHSQFRQRITATVDRFIDISQLSPSQAATQINQDGIHILIDLKGYTDHHRQEIFALQPTPVAISYLGYPGTTGATYIDYVIADDFVLPPKNYQFFSETPILLPLCYRSTDNQIGLPSQKIPKKVFDLPENKFIFASFNHPYKLNQSLLSAWTKILKHTPNSILWQYIKNSQAADSIKAYFNSQGIDPQRIIPATNIEKSHHLDRLRLADIALDPFPITGHTTTTDNLLIGLPTITLHGHHFASKVSASTLLYSSVPELITHSVPEYINTTINLYSHPQRLHRIRSKLTQQTPSSKVIQPHLLTHYLEKAYIKAWEDHFHHLHQPSIRIHP